MENEITDLNQSAEQQVVDQVETGNAPAEVELPNEAAPAEALGINDDIVREYLSKDKEKFKDLFEPEVKEINPYADVMDDEDKAYLDFKKQTGRGKNEYELLKRNYDEVSSLELSRERVKKESGIKGLTTDKIDQHLENELGIHDITDMTASEEIKLARYSKSLRDEYKAEQEKYRKPVEKSDKNPEYVKLDNGSVMPKGEYEKILLNQQKHIADAKEAVNSVTVSSFKIAIGEGEDKQELVYEYEKSDADKQSLLSSVSDLNKVMSAYHTKDGYDHKKFNEDLFWFNSQNREKAFASLAHKVRADAIEEVLKQRGNVNYQTRNGLQSGANNGPKTLPLKDFFNL